MISAWPPSAWLTAGVLVAFGLDWMAIIFDRQKIKPWTKILAMTTVIVWTLAVFGFRVGGLAVGLIAAQVFGLLGDFFLLYPKGFIFGLVAFLGGHIAYMITLIRLWQVGVPGGYMRMISWWGLIMAGIILVVILAGFISLMLPHLRKNQAKGPFLMAVWIYAGVLAGITIMAAVFVLHAAGIGEKAGLLLAGSVLFLVSDFLLVYNRYAHAIANGQLWVRITYHLAQFSLAASLTAIMGTFL